MKRLVVACAALVLLGSASWAGVVVEMEVIAPESPERQGSEVFSVQGKMTRTDMPSAGGKGESVIFRDQTMYFLDHAKKKCGTISKEDLDQISSQLSEVMKQMEAMPPEQRAMMEQMMQGKMPGAKKPNDKEPPKQRVETGASVQVGEYTCTLYTYYSDDQKIREVCMGDESIGADVEEAMEAFRALAEFSKGMMEMAANLPFAGMIETAVQHLEEVEGFPVRTRIFDGDGKVTLERTLKSIRKQEIDPKLFEVPKGYKKESLQKKMQMGGM